MNFRLTAIFFGLVVLLVAALLVVAFLDDETETRTDAGLVEPLTRTGLKEKDIDTVEITRTEPGEETLKFVKTGDGKWELIEPVKARVDSAAVDGVIRDLFSAKPTRYAELTENLAVHGLDKPTIKVTLKQGADKTATVAIGNTTIGGDRAVTFVTSASNPKKPIAVKKSDLANLFRDGGRGKDGAAWTIARWLADYRIKRLIGVDMRDPSSDAELIKISTGGQTLALSRGSNGAWKFDSPAGYGEAEDLGDSAPATGVAPITGVRPLLNTITTLQTQTPDDVIDKPADLATYGLKADDPSALRIELKGKNGAPEVLWLGKVVEDNGKPVTPTRVYARIEGDPAVFKIMTDRTEVLRKTATNPGELRNKDIIAASRRDKIDALDLTVGGATFKLRRLPGGEAGPKWIVYGGANPVEARASEVEGLLTALTQPRAAREVLPSPNDAAFAPPEIKADVKVYFDGVEKPEKVEAGKLPAEPKLKGAPALSLLIGKQEGDIVFVRKESDGAKVDLKVPQTIVPLVTRTRLDYIDPGILGFDTNTATRLAFNRGAETFDLAKGDSTTGTWTYSSPAAKKGTAADAGKVGALLGLLSGSLVERVVSEAPTPDDLKKWAIEPARLTVTIGLKDDPKGRVFQFGNETDDKKSVYARQQGRPYVFLVAKSIVDRFLTDDLRDPTLFKLDLAKVKKLKIRGWLALSKSQGGTAPLEYLFEKKGNDWVAVSPPTPAGFTPETAKINGLLLQLNGPRADSFVDVAAMPEYGLDVAQNPDGIEFTIEQEGGPTRTLVLGNKVANDPSRVYGASSGVPGEIFTLSQGILRTLTEKPASLGK